MEEILFLDLEKIFEEENVQCGRDKGPVFCGIIACGG